MSPDSPGRLTKIARALSVLIAGRTAARTLMGKEPAHEPPPDRPEVDPAERQVPANRGAETLVAVLLLLAGLAGAAFTVVYILAGHNTQLLGLAVGSAFVMIAAALIIAGKLVVPQETKVEQRNLLLDERQTQDVIHMIEAGGEGISRRALLTGASGAAGAGLVVALVTPLASAGPKLTGIHTTPWHAGVRLVDDQGKPYSADEIEIGSFYTALPEHADPELLGSGLLVVRLPADYIHLPPARRAWAPEGILAYSKICPHAGCAISLYRYPTYAPTSLQPAFTCPCHYSTFLPGEGGRLIFGPAGRALPQLPLTIDASRNLRAAGPFHEDVGPSWWNVHRGQS